MKDSRRSSVSGSAWEMSFTSRRGRRDGVDAATPPAQDHVSDVKKKCKTLTEKYESRGVAFHCVHKEDVAGALAGIFTMGIAMNDDKVYLVVTQKDASAE